MAYDFPLEPGETVIRVLRRHWVALLPIIISGLLLLATAIAISYLSGRYGVSLGLVGFAAIVPIVVAVLAGLALVVFLGGLYIYRQSRLILTTAHVIKVEQNGLFGRSVSEISLDQIEHVEGERRGFFATVLNYGTITIETAGMEKNSDFILAPAPQSFVDQVVQAQGEFEKNERRSE